MKQITLTNDQADRLLFILWGAMDSVGKSYVIPEPLKIDLRNSYKAICDAINHGEEVKK